MLATLLLLGLTLVAAATDLLRHKIYNWTTYSGILAALALNALGTALLADGRVQRSWLDEKLGYVGLADSLVGLAICGLIMLGLLRVSEGRRRRRQADGHARGLPGHGGRDRSHALDLRARRVPGGLIVLIWRVGPLAAGRHGVSAGALDPAAEILRPAQRRGTRPAPVAAVPGPLCDGGRADRPVRAAGVGLRR